MQVWGGGPAFGQRLADRQGVRHRGENRVSSHTSLHTNLPISVRKCARGTRTGSRQRGFSGVEDLGEGGVKEKGGRKMRPHN